MIRCIIIDDEPLAVGIIKSYCEDFGNIEVVATFTNPLKAMEVIAKKEVDLVFLDIEMPQITGIDFIKAIDQKPYFIFTTAYPQYAIDGFELNAVDYLVKPIPFARFIKSVNRVKGLMDLKKGYEQSSAHPSSVSGIKTDDFIFVKSDYGNVKIRLEDIKYIQGLKDYLKINIKDQKPILTLMNFRDMQTKLANNNFIRVHRSFIVNINSIDALQKSKIIIDDDRIPIGESYREDFMKRIGL